MYDLLIIIIKYVYIRLEYNLTFNLIFDDVQIIEIVNKKCQ